ncbi:MAG: hypothetical protein QXY40_00525 [Candidatus Methanomethylicia archaeon]
MGGRVELIVAEPINGDLKCVRLDEATMKYLGVKPGDEVDVFSPSFSPSQIRAKVEKANPEDEGLGIIRISRDKMLEGGFKPGMRVLVDKSWIKSLKLTLLTKYRPKTIEIEAPELVTEEEEVVKSKQFKKGSKRSV